MSSENQRFSKIYKKINDFVNILYFFELYAFNINFYSFTSVLLRIPHLGFFLIIYKVIEAYIFSMTYRKDTSVVPPLHTHNANSV